MKGWVVVLYFSLFFYDSYSSSLFSWIITSFGLYFVSSNVWYSYCTCRDVSRKNGLCRCAWRPWVGCMTYWRRTSCKIGGYWGREVGCYSKRCACGALLSERSAFRYCLWYTHQGMIYQRNQCMRYGANSMITDCKIITLSCYYPKSVTLANSKLNLFYPLLVWLFRL